MDISLYSRARMAERAQGAESHGRDYHRGTPGTCPPCHAEEFDALLSVDRDMMTVRTWRAER